MPRSETRARAGRVVWRRRDHPRRAPLAEHGDLEFGPFGIVGRIDIGVREAASDGAPVRRASNAPHRLTLAIYGLVLEWVGVSRGESQNREPAFEAAAALSKQRILSNEAWLLEVEETIETGFQRGVFRAEVAPQRAIALLQAERLNGAASDQREFALLARSQQRVEKLPLILDRMMQLPAKFADIIDAERPHCGREPDSQLAV